jgi:hypothetical protein
MKRKHREQPDPGQELAAAFAELSQAIGDGLNEIALVFAAQGALAQLLDANEAAARQALAGLNEVQLARVSIAAAALAKVARAVRG